ncbi:MAG: hypothetical protein IKU37_08950 [Candidatus Gastranaerophilales bacterium]|nr:hypothetical protein [Candidatus Gastranaerophilales bacterium]
MCNCVNNIIPVTNKTLSAGQLTLTVPNRQFVNYARYKLVGVEFLPEMIGTEQAYIVSNAISYPLIDKAGNIVTSGRLLQSDKYCLQFGANGLGGVPHFVVLTCIPTRIAYNPTAVLQPQTEQVTQEGQA